MKQVLCKLPNASENISGVAFQKTKDGMLAASVSVEDAAKFDGIPGYEVSDANAAAQPKRAPKTEADKGGASAGEAGGSSDANGGK